MLNRGKQTHKKARTPKVEKVRKGVGAARGHAEVQTIQSH